MRIAAVLILLSLSQLIAAARDWSKDPAIIELDTPEQIFAVGDAHSDSVRLAAAMRGAGVIDSQNNWSGRQAILITTGDMIDKGSRALDVLRLLMKLRDQAGKAGGRVIILAGNHEAEFLADPDAPKGKEFADQLRAAGIKPAEVAGCKGEIGTFLCSLAFGARINDWFFSHAGNTGGRSIAQLRRDIEAGFDNDGYNSQQLTGGNSLLEAKLDKDGPRGMPWIQEGMPVRNEPALLAAYASALGVAHIVEGHKPSAVVFADGTERRPGEMFQRFGLLFLIDTGMSGDIDYSDGAVLNISSKSADATAVCPDGTRTLLWDAEGKQSIGRAARCVG